MTDLLIVVAVETCLIIPDILQCLFRGISASVDCVYGLGMCDFNRRYTIIDLLHGLDFVFC